MFLEETTVALKHHAVRFDLETKAVECCKEYICNFSEEDAQEVRFYLSGVAIEDLEFEFVKHQLVFGHYRDWPRILSNVKIGCGKETFAYYELETGENGEILDDWFSWDDKRDEDGKIIEFSLNN